jgi:hypothetical protein
MKKLIFVFAALAFSFASLAQTDTTKKKMDHDKMMNHDQMDMSKTDGCMMMSGKMMMIKNGKMSDMKKPMTMNNGTKMMVDGTCVKKDGTKMKMKEGDHMDMEGNMHPMKGTKTKGEL